MTSNPEVSTVENSKRMTRSQLKRIREEDEEIQGDSKKLKAETLNFKLSSSLSLISITKTDKNPDLFEIIKRMKSTQDEVKSLIKKSKNRNLKETKNHRKFINENDRKREELWDQLEVSQGSYVEKRNALWSLHREIQNLKTNIKENRGEEVLIEGSQVIFTAINEE